MRKNLAYDIAIVNSPLSRRRLGIHQTQWLTQL
jgi:hypothetical protein